jgi:hypothetical protein
MGTLRAVRPGARLRQPAVVAVVALRIRVPGVSGGSLVPEVPVVPVVPVVREVPEVREALTAPEASSVPEAAEAALAALEAALGAMVEPVALPALAAAVAPAALTARGEALVGLRVDPVRGGRCCRRGPMLSVRPGSFGRRVPSPSGVRGRRLGGPGVRRRLRLLGVRRALGLVSGGPRAAGGTGLVLRSVARSVPLVAVPRSGS